MKMKMIKKRNEMLENFKKWFTVIEYEHECFYFLDEADNEIIFSENSIFFLWCYRYNQGGKPFSRRYSIYNIEKKFKKFGIVKKDLQGPKQ